MRLLFDQNLSYKLKNHFKNEFPGSCHVSDHHLIESLDNDIWNFARANNYTIVTQDIDFFEIMLVKGFPPKIIWFKKGNSSTKTVRDALNQNIASIFDFELNNDLGCLEIY
jgi:predicted nuclease of predicted toxin-antitoxin system